MLCSSCQSSSGWKRNSWNSFFRRHLLNLIIWKDMKSAFQRRHTHIKPLSVPSCQRDPAVCDMTTRTIYFCGGVTALHPHSPHTHTDMLDKQIQADYFITGQKKRVKLMMEKLHGQLKRPINELLPPKT